MAKTSKIRIRAVSETGEAIANIRVELVTITPEADAKRSQANTFATDVAVLGSLRTSRDGFSIFSLARLANPSEMDSGLAVRFAGRVDLTYALSPAALAGGAAYFPFTLPTIDFADEAAALGPWLDEGIEPDDVAAIPSTFPDLGDLEFGDDYCGRLIPNDRTVRVFDHNYVVRTNRDSLIGTMSIVRKGGDRLGGSHVALHYEADGIHIDEGDLASFQIRWLRLGYTFGDLLYSLPLAPCESVSLAISHWEQSQSARAEQTTSSQEGRSSSYTSHSAVAEAMNALSNQWHVGAAMSSGSSAGGGGSGSGVIYGMLLKATGALQTTVGATLSGSYDRSRFAANATRDMSNSIQQAAEAWRRDHQVVVMEQKESEDHQVSTRTVCNNNHCHVLNIFYHEVLCNHRVSTRLMGHREVYLVPYELMTFDRASATCLRPILAPFLLDQTLLTCGDAEPEAAEAPVAPKTVNKFRVELTIDDVRRQPWFLSLRIVAKVGGPKDTLVPRSDSWIGGYTYQYDVDTIDYLPEDLRQVGIALQSTGGFGGAWNLPTVTVSSFKISMLDPDSGQWTQIATGSPGPIVQQGASLANVTQGGSGATGDTSQTGDCLDRLVAHLNCHGYYYNSLVWLLEDPNERIDRLDQIVCGSGSLLDLILPEPVAVMGHYVAFAKSGSDYEPYDEQPIIEDRLVVVPTPGIFADAALGHCTTCETVDETKYWDWSKTPCLCCGAAPALKVPEASSLLGSAATAFPAYPTTNLTNLVGASPDSGANSLVAAFGGALATAMLSGKGTSDELGQLKELLGKLTDAVDKLAPDPGEGPPAKDPE